MVSKKYQNQPDIDKVNQIIEMHDLDVTRTNEDFYIVGAWRDIETLVNEYNSIPKDEYAMNGDIRRDSVSGEYVQNAIEKYGWDSVKSPFFSDPDKSDIEEILGDWGFSDEYDMCSDCGNVIRTSPDSYSWTPEYWQSDNGIFCGDCIEPQNYIENIKNKLEGCYLVDPIDYGWVRIREDYESGLYEGANDNPEKILELLKGAGIDVLFKVYPSQFSQVFEVYVPQSMKVKTDGILEDGDVKYAHGHSPAEICKRYLDDASRKIAELQKRGKRGILYSRPDKDGNAIVRVVSPEEFIEGIKEE